MYVFKDLPYFWAMKYEMPAYFLLFRGSEKLIEKNKRKAEKLIEEVQIIKVSNNVAQILQ